MWHAPSLADIFISLTHQMDGQQPGITKPGGQKPPALSTASIS